jgi:hypothetical protein
LPLRQLHALQRAAASARAGGSSSSEEQEQEQEAEQQLKAEEQEEAEEALQLQALCARAGEAPRQQLSVRAACGAQLLATPVLPFWWSRVRLPADDEEAE